MTQRMHECPGAHDWEEGNRLEGAEYVDGDNRDRKLLVNKAERLHVRWCSCMR